jgi:hypothetical protein
MSQHKDALGAFVAKFFGHFLFLSKVFSLGRENIGTIGLCLGFAFGNRGYLCLTTGNWQLLNPLQLILASYGK